MPSIMVQQKSPISAITELDARKTPWRSIWLCNTLQLLNGIQFSILFTSMWPYLRILDSTANVDFYGWIVAVFPLGQTVASFLFGVWNQKTKTAKYPVATGAAIMGIGNFIYGTLPLYKRGAKWIMLTARFIVGFGSGNLSVLRTYVATATAPKDRVKALSVGIGMFVLGLSIGPAVMLIFTPLGPNGFHLGWFPVTMYNFPALVMVLIAIASLTLLFTCFQEEYAGIINTKKSDDSFSDVVVPKFDKLAAFICIGVWFVLQSVGTNSEVLMIPLTMAIYNWKNGEAIFYNGIIVFASTVISFSIYLIIGLTRVGKFDKRKMIVFGLSTFMLYHLINIPWPFYSGPLDYMPTDKGIILVLRRELFRPRESANSAKYMAKGDQEFFSTFKIPDHNGDVFRAIGNSTVEDTSVSGGCFRRYEWCAHTTRIPLPLYVFASTILTGISFPNVGSPCGTLFAEILGPRNQGFMQGMFAFFGSTGRFLGPIISTALFESNGYLLPMVILLTMLAVAVLTIIIFHHRLVPLQLIPPVGVPTPYKHGTFYRL
ncbi:Major facilitator superfamily domain-containing protein 8 [Toxocara canis]|uniref:Major facilitator superfamily domain-containing protein 8 n=1 Tax=Toxocara canis TaxID=6265 RepID=A0A0B2VLQ8_TOXCA|nr:Major facilitator superfamily domain-containing protein 8 [Toxocara canis]